MVLSVWSVFQWKVWFWLKTFGGFVVGFTGTLGLDLDVPDVFWSKLLTETNLSSFAPVLGT